MSVEVFVLLLIIGFCALFVFLKWAYEMSIQINKEKEAMKWGGSNITHAHDYFMREIVRLFSVVHFNFNRQAPEDSAYQLAMGEFRCFLKGDKLPLSTWHYQYPSSFFVLSDEAIPQLYLIENGILKGYKSPKRFASKLEEYPIYDFAGRQLNIHHETDLLNYLKEKRDYTIEQGLKQEEMLRKIHQFETDKAYEWEKSSIFDLEENFISRWHTVNETEHLEEFGAWLSCYASIQEEYGGDVYVTVQAFVLSNAKAMIQLYPGLAEEYWHWISRYEAPCTKEEYDQLIESIMEQ